MRTRSHRTIGAARTATLREPTDDRSGGLDDGQPAPTARAAPLEHGAPASARHPLEKSVFPLARNSLRLVCAFRHQFPHHARGAQPAERRTEQVVPLYASARLGPVIRAAQTTESRSRAPAPDMPATRSGHSARSSASTESRARPGSRADRPRRRCSPNARRCRARRCTPPTP